MISAKEALLESLKSVIDYPIVSVYPNMNIVPICVILEENNTSIDRFKDYMETVYAEYRFILIDNDIDRLNENINKLDEYLLDLNFIRSLYEEYNTIQECRGVTIVYSGDLRIKFDEPNIIKVYKS